jgi:leucyl aminopeptidase (aminopeptidase T)
MASLLEKATENVAATIVGAMKHQPSAQALIVFDRQSALSSLLADAYIAALPSAKAVDFNETSPEDIRAEIERLSPGDLVALVQSSSFRLNEFRFRLELFNRGLAVIEHPHLGRMPENEYEIYIDSLAYDAEYYQRVGKKLKELIDKASRVVVSCEGTELVYDTPLEDAKLNIGDYTGMKNRGGQFPIGEVFTEPKDVFQVNGMAKLFGYADANFHVIVPDEPVLVRIEKGVLVEAINPPESFVKVLDQIKADEEVWVRELGFGMNRALTRNRRLTDIGSYERMCGIHLSLGQKHTIYAKEGMPKRSSKYHVDVFVDVEKVTIDDVVVFENGSYTV